MNVVTSYAQWDTDWAILAQFPDDYVGTYLDAGASYPISGSNTYLLYERGWCGITIEPCEAPNHEQMRFRPRDYQIRAAVSNRVGTVDFFAAGESTVSTLCPIEAAKQVERRQPLYITTIPTLRFADLNLNFEPDVVSIDVEGYERQALEGFPFDRWRPRVFVLEACFPCTETASYHLWEDLLLDRQYHHIQTCGVNRIYRV